MEVKISAFSPAQKRLVAAFLNDLADLQELECATPGANLISAPPPPQVKQEEPEATQPKKSRKSKPADPIVAEPVAAAEPEPAPVGETPSAGGAEPPAETGQASDAQVVTHDDIRRVFGELAQKGLRDKGIAIVTELGHASIKAIPDEELAGVYEKLKAVKA